MSLETQHFYQFKNFRIDLNEKILLRDGKPLMLTPKAFQLLMVLVQNQGRIIEKDRLMNEIWSDSFVEEGNLAVSVMTLRKVLEDNAAQPTFIETIPRRGYRFIADVVEITGEEEPEIVEPETINTQPSRMGKYLTIAVICVLIASVAGFGAWFVSSAFTKAETKSPILSEPFRASKFSSSGKVQNAVISPDGKYAAFIEGTGSKQSIWLRMLERAENLQIVAPSDDHYFGLTFSNDGNYLYFVRKGQAGHGAATLYRIMAYGGIPAKILDDAQDWVSLSPDDNSISYVRCAYKPDDHCSLYIADSTGQNERKLVSRPNLTLIRANQFSADGRSIIFASGRLYSGESDFHLTRINIADGTESEVSPQKFYDIRSMRLLPGGDSMLLTVRDYVFGKYSIWKVSGIDGKAERLTHDAASYESMSLDQKGSKMVAIQLSNDFQMYLSSGKNTSTLSSARELVFAPEGRIIYSTFDGDIWTIKRDGTEQRQLTSGESNDFSPKLSPDGHSIFFTSNRSGINHVWQMDADGSGAKQITQSGGLPCGFSPDGGSLFYHSLPGERMRRLPLIGGEETAVSDKRLLKPACSPDGRYIAYFFLDSEFKIGIINTADGSVAKVLAYGDGKSFTMRLAWSPDSKSISFITNAAGKNQLWRQALDSEKPELTADLGDEEITDITIADEKDTFAYVRGKWVRDAVLIDGLK